MAELTADERAAIRAFLQRSEVRLSTVHRVATALLSGAGLMVLLPAIANDAIAGVFRSLFYVEVGVAEVCLAVAMAATLALPSIALWLVLRDLARFYFHAVHVPVAGAEVFVPRFTLTSLRLPADELGEGARAELLAMRDDPNVLDLLVPTNPAARARVDERLDAYGGLGRGERGGDRGRADGLFQLVAGHDRPLLDEVAKIEHGMARHMLRLQVIVLRYVKALLAFITTALAVFAVANLPESSDHDLWVAAIAALWAPAIVVATTAPVRWVDALLRAEGASRTAIAADPEFTHVERIAVRVAVVTWVAAAIAAVVEAADRDAAVSLVLAVLAVVAGGAALVVELQRWSRRSRA